MSISLYEKYGINVRAGKVIFDEGEEGASMYVIHTGKVKITKVLEGIEHHLADLTTGDFFGEMSVFMKQPRTAKAVAVEESQLLCFDLNNIQSIIMQQPAIAISIIEKLCIRLDRTNDQLQYLFRLNRKSHIALNLYSRFRNTSGGKLQLAVDRTVRDIALNLQIPQKDVFDLIKDLAEDRSISINGNSLGLVDEQKLVSQTMSE